MEAINRWARFSSLGGIYLDLDLLRIFGVATGKQGLAAPGADTLLSWQLEERLANLQMGALHLRVIRLSVPVQ
jgi:hypothetical protein